VLLFKGKVLLFKGKVLLAPLSEAEDSLVPHRRRDNGIDVLKSFE
jgi:hypothetical protein